MNIKLKLKKRLLEIPDRYRTFREKHKLANDLKVETKYVEFYLNELCEKGILIEKIEYICPNCTKTTILNNDLLEELLDGEVTFECENCCDEINPNKNKTGFVYYDVINKEGLINW